MLRPGSKSKKIWVLSNFLVVIFTVGIFGFLYYGLSLFFARPGIPAITTHTPPVDPGNNADQNVNLRPKHQKGLIKHNAIPFGHPVKRSAIDTHDLGRSRAITIGFFHNVKQVPLFKLIESGQIAIEL